MLQPLGKLESSKYGSLHNKMNISVIIDAKKKKEIRDKTFNENSRSLNIRIKRSINNKEH